MKRRNELCFFTVVAPDGTPERLGEFRRALFRFAE
jgi:hypothetical protein